MNKIQQVVPSGRDIKYISEWSEYVLPKGHCIVDKGVTGCGYTEYTLTNNLPTVLCSPRKLLLENKSEQHQGDINILYLKNEIKDINDINKLKNKIRNHIFLCDEENLPIKFLVTYDSSHYVIDILKELGLLSDFYFIIDEFQSIFLDSFFKSEVEFDFVEYLQDCPNVLYLSATPMLDKYLERINEFKNLPFYEIDWSETGCVENIIIQRKFSTALTTDCIKIVNQYLEGKFPSTFTSDNKIVFSKEAVFYFNSISDIIRVINKIGLTSDQVNIICANDKDNKDKLSKIGHSIGKIPLKGETNKMFTFCTKTAYIGSDFYSDNASSYVFADPNIKSLALDISLDLPQIVGRQRNRENPFKNNIVIFYRTIRKTEMEDRETFDKTQEERRNETQRLLDGFNLLKSDQQQSYIQKLKNDIKTSKYERDFISISKKTNKPVYNSFIDIANERSWEVSQKDYQDKISVTKSLESLTSNISEYQSDLEKEVQDFLDNKFYSTGIFEKKMKMYCEFMDLHQGNKEVSDIIYFKIKDPKYRKYYNFYGTPGCRAASYKEKSLKLGMIDVSKIDELSSVVYKKFQIGSRYTLKEIKSTLQDIYRDLGITSKPKATDLDKYFSLTRTKFSDPKNKKRIEGYLLNSL